MVLEIEEIPIDIDSTSCGEVLPLPDGSFLFRGEFDVEGLGATRWSIRYDPDPIVVAEILTINTSGQPQTYAISVQLPTSFPGPTALGGSLVGSICDGDGDGGSLQAIEGWAIAVAMIDQRPVEGGVLLPAPAEFLTGPYDCSTIDPVEFGSPIPSMPGGGVQTGIAMTLAFRLTPGDAANCIGTFVVEAAPPSPDPSDAAAPHIRQDARKEVQP